MSDSDVSTNAPLPFSPLIEQAIELSAQWHDRTYRKGGWRDDPFEPVDHEVLRVPVVAHLTTVALSVARAGFDDVTIAAAFLHDALEDEDQHGRRFEEDALRKAIGDPVTDLVQFLTERKHDEDGEWIGWRARKEEYLEKLADAPVEAMAISVADKLHNLWSINQALARGIDVYGRTHGRRPLTAGPDEQRWFYRSVRELAERHRDPRLRPLLQQFDEELERFEAEAQDTSAAKPASAARQK